MSLLLFVFVCGCCLVCACFVRGALCDAVGICCRAIVLRLFVCAFLSYLLLCVLCLIMFVCFVCGLSCGIVCVDVFV